MRQPRPTHPLKFWVITRAGLPANVIGLRYQTSETAASTTALVTLFAFVFSSDGSWAVEIVMIAVAGEAGVSDSVLAFITDPGFISGL